MPPPAGSPTSTRDSWRSATLAAALACLVLLPLLGHRPLTDWDEGIYAEIAREMLAAHRWQAWVVPHWNGGLWFEKPPLALWLMALSMRLFGLNALAARLPSALAGVASVTLLHLWLQRRFGSLAAWLGTALLLSSFGFQHAARAGETDSPLTLFCLVGLLGLAELSAHRPRGAVLFWAGLGCAAMTKGAAALPLLFTPLLLLLLPRLSSRRSRPSPTDNPLPFHPSVLAGVPLFLLLTLAWPLTLGLHFGQRFWAEFLSVHTLTRATSAMEGHHTTPFFFLGVLLVSAPPFALLYPFAAAAAWRLRGTSARQLLPFLVFAVLELCLFSAARTRLPHYIDPVYPPLFAITAVWLAAVTHRTPAAAPRSRWRSAYLFWPILALAFLIGAAVTTGPRRRLHANHLPDGRLTPDNREAATLLQAALRSGHALPLGPLLVWHRDPVTPLTTDAFYSQRLVAELTTALPVLGSDPDRYTWAPTPWTTALQSPHLVLLDRDLLPQLPSHLQFRPLEAGPRETVGLLLPDPDTQGR